MSPLMEFFSMSPADALATFGEGAGLGPGDLGKFPPENWFPPQDGLKTVRALLGETSERLPEGAHEDLLEFERVLSVAAERGLQWHLVVDY